MAIRVAIVDDTADLRLLLRIHLERDGRFEVVGEAADGQEGIDLVDAQTPDAVVLDLAMPHMDGLTALPIMRERHPHVVIVVLSGFAAGQLQRRVVDAGADGYVAKGTDFADLANELARLHGQRAAVS